MPLSVGLPCSRKRTSRTTAAEAKAITARVGIRAPGIVPRKAGWRNAGALVSPGRQMMATNTDSKNSSPRRGAIARITRPHSRNTAKAMKFRGRRKATASSAIRPGPERTARPPEKNSIARWASSKVRNANKSGWTESARREEAPRRKLRSNKN